jgi:hypothetical protein
MKFPRYPLTKGQYLLNVIYVGMAKRMCPASGSSRTGRPLDRSLHSWLTFNRKQKGRKNQEGGLIGTLRRECLDQVVIFGETHLRRILSAYAAYYNQARTHLALQKDAPLHRAVQRSGAVVAIPILARLHHQRFSESTGDGGSI